MRYRRHHDPQRQKQRRQHSPGFSTQTVADEAEGQHAEDQADDEGVGELGLGGGGEGGGVEGGEEEEELAHQGAVVGVASDCEAREEDHGEDGAGGVEGWGVACFEVDGGDLGCGIFFGRVLGLIFGLCFVFGFHLVRWRGD